MKIRRSLAGALAVGMAAAALSACANPAGSGGDSDTATVILGVEATRGLDPAVIGTFTPSGDANRMSAIYGALFWADAATGKVNPGLGESLTTGDGEHWTMRLRPDLRFSDGTALDAEAVKFNYERHADPATHSTQQDAAKGLKMKVDDPRTLEITLPEANRQFDRTIAKNLTYIASPTAIRKEGKDFTNRPVGAGPFMLKDWVRDDHMTLVRNPNYWEKGRPYLKTVIIKPIADPVQRINTVASGQAQIAVPGSELSFKKRAEQSGLAVTDAPAGGGPMLIFNTKSGPFADKRARQAVAYALNPDDLVKVVDPGSTAPKGVLADNSPFFDASTPLPRNDPAKAQQLLNTIAADGKPLKFALTVPASGFFRKTAEYIQSRLSSLRNVTVQVDTVDNATLTQRVFRDKDFQASVQIVPVTDPEPDLFNLLHSDGITNQMSYHSAAMDQALEKGRSATDEAGRKGAYADMQRILATDVPIYPYRNQDAYTVHGKSVSGITLYGEGALLFDRLRVGK
ncbi:ABC transporter substrate-binding protein [Actinomadura nitritigenes]|uniref:ABC transporter substrate-binding protein n=1 Tax=Actinomadura nitritigenes TaxID=134602 RepID=UPI003D8EE350